MPRTLSSPVKSANPVEPVEGRECTLDVTVLDELQKLERRVGKSLLPGMFDVLHEHVPMHCARMRLALVEKDTGTLRRLSHNLKSSARSLGLARLSAACAELEHRCVSSSAVGAESLVSTIEKEYDRASLAVRRFLGT